MISALPPVEPVIACTFATAQSNSSDPKNGEDDSGDP
jgi:hypothetical protein